MKRRADAKPTWTFLVQEALRVADDFLSAEQLRETTGANRDQLSAALHHLQKRKVVDAVEGPDGLWWFYRGEDDRTFVLEERVPEEPGTRNRKRKQQQ